MTAVLDNKNLEAFSATKFREPIDSFVDCLVEGQETRISEFEKDLDAKTALKLEFKSRHLRSVPLSRFNVDASHWPEFIECFYTRVRCKSFSHSEILVSCPSTKRSMKESIGVWLNHLSTHILFESFL